MKVHCRQNLLTLRVCGELDFLRTVSVCPANSLSGKERPPGVDPEERCPQGPVQRESLSGPI